MKKLMLIAETEFSKDTMSTCEDGLCTLLGNIACGKMILLDKEKNVIPITKDAHEMLYKTLEEHKTITVHVKKEELIAKLVIDIIDPSKLLLYPMEPLCRKKSITMDHEEVDLKPYIMMIIQMCTNLIILDYAFRRILRIAS